MARRRWGDRFADNTLIGYIVTISLGTGFGLFLVACLVVAIGFGWAILAGLAPGITGLKMQYQLNHFILTLPEWVGMLFMVGISGSAAVAIVFYTAIAILNELDNIIVHGRL